MSRPMSDSGIVERRPSFWEKWIFRPIIVVFDGAWHVLAYILGAVIVGGIVVNALISLITTGTPGVADPRTWVIIRSLLAQPVYGAVGLGIVLVLILCAYLGHRAHHKPGSDGVGDKELKKIYGLAPVMSAEPSNTLIPSFDARIYVPRRTADTHADADALARTLLHDAISRRDPTSREGSFGLCVYGRKLLGTSRLAWEAMKHVVEHDREFRNWTLVRWPTEPRRYRDLISALADRHAQVVIWLENLPDLVVTDTSIRIKSLPVDLAEAKIPFVVLATCHDGFGEKTAHKIFGDLMDHFTPIKLADISQDEARHLLVKLGRAGDQDQLDNQYDGTPGSIVLAVTSMRDQVYPKLPSLAQQALRAMKLLHSAGIRDYPIKRVIATARDVFDAAGSAGEWDHALPALKDAGYVNIQMVAGVLEMTNDVYLDLAVPSDASARSHAADEWPKLKLSLEHEQDWKALARLGDAFRRRGDVQQAESCYRGALGGLTKDTAAEEWALAQFGLGSILLGQLEATVESQRGPLVEQAKRAFTSVLSIVTPESDPTIAAEASGGLATVYRIEAETGLDALLRQGGPTTRQKKIRGKALESALAESRDAFKVLKKETAPVEWAEAEHQLGLVYYVTSELSLDARDRRTKLDMAIEAHRRALTVFTESENPTKVARVERAMGDACKLRADASIRPRKDEMLEQAISAYSHALGISTARQIWSGDELAALHASLACCLRSLALLNEVPRRSELLQNAVEQWRAATLGFDQESSAVLKAEALRDLGGTLCDLGALIDVGKRPALWNESHVAFTDAFRVLGGHGTRSLRAQLSLGLATVHWQRATSTVPPLSVDIVQAFGNAQHAEHTFQPGEHAAELSQARKIARDAERKARELKIPLPGQRDASSPRNQRAAS